LYEGQQRGQSVNSLRLRQWRLAECLRRHNFFPCLELAGNISPMTKHISIWLRDDVPSAFAEIIPNFWHEEEPVVAVAHVPNHVLKAQLYEMTKSLAPYPPKADPDPRMRWFSESGVGFFGSNAVEFMQHPTGDGHIIVCRFI